MGADTSAHPGPRVIGLTGGIGSGKSAAADCFAELGATLVDADVIARALTAPGGAAIEPLRAAFGDWAITSEGALDRAAMRERAFADATVRQQLEGILHPLIRQQCEREIAAATGPYVLLVVPLLVETGGWIGRCERIVVVDCPEDLQRARVMQRSGLSEAQVRAIMDSQASRAQRRAAAHEIIDNAGDFDSLRAQVDALHQRFLPDRV
ncbi:dephospho-CoA kinase [Viridibacterium curvum]|uniref:Dephospho-CoA kinase n=1 Tax=Viridibacterium curvum TaxID=1101404 RepID=A0ABP9QZ23_9RHOO